MDNHPIPQDVTGFQFKLIGNMTVKQFAYLATGVVFAWVLLQLPVNILIKFPLAAVSALLGTGLAYFPISGRPMDLMIGNYIKALFKPTQFIYRKTGGQIYFPHQASIADIQNITQYKNAFNPLPKDKLKAYLASLDTKPKNKADEIENNFLTSLSGLTANIAPLQTNMKIEQPVPTLMPQQSEVPQQPIPKIQTVTAKPMLRGINRSMGTLSAPEYPNLITGITKDPRGNALTNILVEVKDKDGNPVRAFKTNEVGRFASATPLINGTYTIEFEDPKAQNKFEGISINVAGQIILPIEAVSVDTREELRRSLFSTDTKAN